MYCNTKLANRCRVTERAEFTYTIQHIVETRDGYILRIKLDKMLDHISLHSVLITDTHPQMSNYITIPTRDYKSLRAAYKAFIALAPMHRACLAEVY